MDAVIYVCALSLGKPAYHEPDFFFFLKMTPQNFCEPHHRGDNRGGCTHRTPWSSTSAMSANLAVIFPAGGCQHLLPPLDRAEWRRTAGGGEPRRAAAGAGASNHQSAL